MREHVVTYPDTAVPFSNDYMLSNAAKFITKGMAAAGGQPRILHFVGDATHDCSKQKLKRFVLGFAATHFHRGQWCTTLLPVMYCACDQESKVVLLRTIMALEKMLRELFGLNLKDHVLDWFWDGAPEATAVFGEYFGFPGHLYLQHLQGPAEAPLHRWILTVGSPDV